MRLRSSQFVFLLLLVCSVQIQQEYASGLIAAGISGRIAAAPRQREAATHLQQTQARQPLSAIAQPRSSGLDAAARAAQRVAWTPRRPARESADVCRFTGFLRA